MLRDIYNSEFNLIPSNDSVFKHILTLFHTTILKKVCHTITAQPRDLTIHNRDKNQKAIRCLLDQINF